MAKPIEKSQTVKTEFDYTERELKNVLVPATRTKEDIKVKVLPFDEFNEKHTAFAFRYLEVENARGAERADAVTDLAREFVETFVVHSGADIDNPASNFNKVCGDVRACRTLLGDAKFRDGLLAFFINA